MTQKQPGPDRTPFFIIAVFAVGWSVVVALFVAYGGGSTGGSTPGGRLWTAAPLAVVGAVICALGYMSMLKRRAMRRSQSSLERLLKQARQKPL
jgi:NADH:ubiquinone oxidoreductase subunit K